MVDVFAAGTPLEEFLRLAFGEFDGASRKNDVGSESAAGFYKGQLSLLELRYLFGRICNGKWPSRQAHQ